MKPDQSVTLPQTKADATPHSQNTLISKAPLSNIEPLPGPSKLITTRQESLQPWLSYLQNRFVFLSKFELSDTFTHLASILNSQEEDKKKCIEFLVALDNISTETNNLSQATQYFVEEVLKNTRFLIQQHRDCSTQLVSYTQNPQQTNFAEDLKNLQNRLQVLKNEKTQLEKLQHPDAHITRLYELTRDFDKLKVERCRDFTHEISECEAELETNKQALKKIEDSIEANGKDLLNYDDQVEVELKLNQRKISNLKSDLHFLEKFEKQIDLSEINEVFLTLLNLENTRLKLISEWEEFDPVEVLLEEIKEPNTELVKLSTEKGITTDLFKNNKSINVITETLEDILNFLSTHGKDTIGTFVIKVKSILAIISDKRKIEAKIIKLVKLIKNTKSEDMFKPLFEQYEINKDLSNKIRENYSLNLNKICEFLQKNKHELKKDIKQLIYLKKDKITQLLNKKSILELMAEKINLINKIIELKEKIQVIKTEKQAFKLFKDHHLLEKLVLVEKLQNKSANTIQEIDQLLKKIALFEKNIKELQKDNDSSTVQANKVKILSLKKKKTQFSNDLNYLTDQQKSEIEAEKRLRDPIEKILNNIKNTQTLNCPIKLLQNERSLRFNLLETTRLIKDIEKLKDNALKNKQHSKIKAKQEQIENQIFQVIQDFSGSQLPTSTDNLFFENLKTQLYALKAQIENPNWNKSGWGFFYKKVPDGIQKLRAIFNEDTFIHLESEHDEGLKKLILLSIFSKINAVIDKKNTTSNFYRCRAVNDLYQTSKMLLNPIDIEFFTLRNSVTETNENETQPTCSYSLHS